MLNIEVANEYRLTSDGMQIVVQRKKVVDPTKSPKFDARKMSAEPYEKWLDWKYCSRIEYALELIAQQRIHESDARTLADLLNQITGFRREISHLLRATNK